MAMLRMMMPTFTRDAFNAQTVGAMAPGSGRKLYRAPDLVSPPQASAFRNALGWSPGCATVARPECELYLAEAYQAVVP